MGDQACFIDGGLPTGAMCPSPTASDWTGNTGIQPPGGPSEDIFQDLFTTGESLPTETPNNVNQSLYYVATGEHIQNCYNNYVIDVN